MHCAVLPLGERDREGIIERVESVDTARTPICIDEESRQAQAKDPGSRDRWWEEPAAGRFWSVLPRGSRPLLRAHAALVPGPGIGPQPPDHGSPQSERASGLRENV